MTSYCFIYKKSQHLVTALGCHPYPPPLVKWQSASNYWSQCHHWDISDHMTLWKNIVIITIWQLLGMANITNLFVYFYVERIWYTSNRRIVIIMLEHVVDYLILSFQMFINEIIARSGRLVFCLGINVIFYWCLLFLQNSCVMWPFIYNWMELILMKLRQLSEANASSLVPRHLVKGTNTWYYYLCMYVIIVILSNIMTS